MKKVIVLLFMTGLFLMSCSEREFENNIQMDKYGDFEASLKREQTLKQLEKMDIDPIRKAKFVEELNKDQIIVRQLISSELKEIGINPDDVLLSSVENILANAGPFKPSLEKASQAECDRALNSYLKQLGYSFSTLSGYDLALLANINYQVSGSYNFATRDQYVYSAGMTLSQAISITGISWPNDVFYFRHHDGNIAADAAIGNCY